MLVSALLYVENRDPLAPGARRNPAIDWGRFARAAFEQGMRVIDGEGSRAGGSTLATQIEKFRHSPGGRTHGAGDKLRQMVSASLRAYLDGEETLAARRRIVRDSLTRCRSPGWPATARSTAWATACGRGTDAISPRPTTCWPTAETPDPQLRAQVFREPCR